MGNFIGHRSLSLRRLLVHQGRQHTPNHSQKSRVNRSSLAAEASRSSLSCLPRSWRPVTLTQFHTLGQRRPGKPSRPRRHCFAHRRHLACCDPLPVGLARAFLSEFSNCGLLQGCASQTDRRAVESGRLAPKRRSARRGDAHATNLGSMDGCYALSVWLGAEGAGFAARAVA